MMKKSNPLFSLFLVIFIDAFAMTLIFPIFAPLFSLPANQGGLLTWSLSTAMKNMLYGLTMAIFPLTMFFSSPLLGNLSDQVGRKKILLICLLGEAIGTALSGVAVLFHTFVLFFISRLIAGSMAGSLPIAQAAITDISTEETKTINISLIGLAYSLGFIGGPIIGGVLANKNIVSWFGLSTPLFATTVLATINAIALAFTFQETFLKAAKNTAKVTIKFIKPLIMFAGSFRQKTIRYISLAAFCYILGWNTYMQFIVLYLFQRYHFTTTELGYFVSWLALMMSFAMLAIIRILMRFMHTKRILHFAIVVSIAGIFMTLIPSSTMQWVSVAPIAIGLGLAYATLLTLFSDAVDSNSQGWIMGVSAAIMAAAGGVAGLLVAAISTYQLLTFLAIVLLWAACYLFSLLIHLEG